MKYFFIFWGMRLSKSLFICLVCVTLLSSFGRRQTSEPDCSTRNLRIILTSANYPSIPSVEFVNTQYCLPQLGQWRDNTLNKSWTQTSHMLNVVRIDVVSNCTPTGTYWYNRVVQQDANGNCYVDVPIYKRFNNEIKVNGLSNCLMPDLPTVASYRSGGSPRPLRAWYIPSGGNTWTVYGGTGGSATLRVRMVVNPLGFNKLFQFCRC